MPISTLPFTCLEHVLPDPLGGGGAVVAQAAPLHQHSLLLSVVSVRRRLVPLEVLQGGEAAPAVGAGEGRVFVVGAASVLLAPMAVQLRGATAPEVALGARQRLVAGVLLEKKDKVHRFEFPTRVSHRIRTEN